MIKKLKILLTGANGQLGQALMHLPDFSEKALWIPTDYLELDITNYQAVDSFIGQVSPDFIINCAAFTAVDLAEKEYDKALMINANGPENLAIAAKSAGIPLIHISTDYVFAGQNRKPYVETDEPNPQSAYGKTKLAGEQALLKIGGKVIIVRTSWLYSEYGKNFFLTMLRLGKDKASIGVVSDQIGSPTYAGDLAIGLMKIVEYDYRHPGWINQPEIYHFCNTGIASWYDLSMAIMEISGLPCHVHPLSTEQYPLPAPRPAYSILDTKKFRSIFWSEIPYWRTSVKCCFEKYQLIKKSI
ncbi:MAG: dTDP-4-dehydrorhamnose reductase [Bacteroidales bacterium]